MKKLWLPVFNLILDALMLALNAYVGRVAWTIAWSAMLICSTLNLMFQVYIGRTK